ncbi:MAG: hypothetical protein CMK71_02615 [Pseudomonadaceae bacterium]|nr:hypothetical protein [Pseudomonadaceae bacterium]|tara:strand:+ start:1513 stop:1719 length:207 start_codon:yes stop_codon:yes gene_type:complete
MSYQIQDTGAGLMRFHITRPGETSPSFYVDTEAQAHEVIEVDKQQSIGESGFKRCPECSAEHCPCIAG